MNAAAGLAFVHAEIATHGGETVTGPHQVGVSFSAHERVGYEVGGRGRTASYGGGSVVATSGEPIVWTRVREPVEALEIYPDPALVQRMSGGAGWPVTASVVGRSDAVVLGVAAVLRRSHVTGRPLDDVATSALAHRLVGHLLVEYGGLPARDVLGPGGGTRLGRRALDAVQELVDAAVELGTPGLTLDAMADAVHLSPFHFSRSFKESTGVTPWEFVTLRRLDRARLLLRTTRLPVELVAARVGLSNVGHFRRLFVARTGCTPARYRELRR